MESLLNEFSFDWKLAITDLIRLLLAFLLAIPIGWERHKSLRSIGLRTFPIVAMAACGYVLVSKSIPGSNAETEARLIQGIITGIGFIGGGAILKEGANVRGLATAASIWCTGAIGAAVAFGREEIGIILSLITFTTLRLLTPVVDKDAYGDIEEKSEKAGDKDSEEN